MVVGSLLLATYIFQFRHILDPCNNTKEMICLQNRSWGGGGGGGVGPPPPPRGRGGVHGRGLFGFPQNPLKNSHSYGTQSFYFVF
jgi:hypothetical protein